MFMHLLKYLAYLLLLFSFVSCGEAKQETAQAETVPTEQGIEYDATSVKNIHQLLNVYSTLKAEAREVPT